MSRTKLEMDFIDQENKNFRISINDPREDLTDLEVFSAMDTILSRDVFQSRNGNLIEKSGARIVTTTIDEMEL